MCIITRLERQTSLLCTVLLTMLGILWRFTNGTARTGSPIRPMTSQVQFYMMSPYVLKTLSHDSQMTAFIVFGIVFLYHEDISTGGLGKSSCAQASTVGRSFFCSFFVDEAMDVHTFSAGVSVVHLVKCTLLAYRGMEKVQPPRKEASMVWNSHIKAGAATALFTLAQLFRFFPSIDILCPVCLSAHSFLLSTVNFGVQVCRSSGDGSGGVRGGATWHDQIYHGDHLGEGAYGVVFKAIDKVTNRTVAVKKFRKEKHAEGFTVTASNVTQLREIELLKRLHDPNIIQLLDVFPYNGTHHLVFELMETDLDAVIQDPGINLSPADYKFYMQMMLKGLAVCHEKGVLHRDLKPKNLLLGFNGQLKLADFGLGRHFGSPNEQFSPREVFVRFYRAPELLFGSKQYGPHVDVWAAACIFAELILRRPFLEGETDVDQLQVIFEAFGTPSNALWPDMPIHPKFKYYPPKSFHELFPQASADCLDLLQRMFTYDLKRRITAQQALEHRYFRTAPTPTPAHMLPRQLEPEDFSEDLIPEDEGSSLSPPAKTQRIQQSSEESRTAEDIRPAVEAIRGAHAKQRLQPSELLGKAIKAAGKAITTVGEVIIQDAHAQQQQGPQKTPQKGRLMRKSREEFSKSLDATRSALRARERRNTEYATPTSKPSSVSPKQKQNGIVTRGAHRAEVIPPEELKRKRHEGMKKRKYIDDEGDQSSEEKIIREMVMSPTVPPSLDDSVEFEVEEVLNSRFINAKLEYFVRWKGYSVDESTWEPAENLENALDRVSAFHQKKPIQAEGMWKLLKRLNPGVQSPPRPQ